MEMWSYEIHESVYILWWAWHPGKHAGVGAKIPWFGEWGFLGHIGIDECNVTCHISSIAHKSSPGGQAKQRQMLTKLFILVEKACDSISE